MHFKELTISGYCLKVQKIQRSGAVKTLFGKKGSGFQACNKGGALIACRAMRCLIHKVPRGTSPG